LRIEEIRPVNADDFKRRTMKFGLAVIELCESLPKRMTTDTIGRQLVRSAVSVGANYRAACRAKSPADFIHKMGIVEEEADEVGYWLEILEKANLVAGDRLKGLAKEADELTAMVVASIKTAKANLRR
jgi:four helix bundle protein